MSNAATPGPVPQPAPAPARLTQADIVAAELAEPEENLPSRPRRIVLPVVLFLLTCVSTWAVGATRWNGMTASGRCFAYEGGTSQRVEDSGLTPLRRLVLRADWKTGLLYAASVMAILLAHEMGHFVFNQYYRVPGSLPYFIPVPLNLNPVGTMGAVIVMQANRANRRELFDIGLAGPLAGLVVCVPVLWLGLRQLDLTQGEPLGIAVDLPLIMRLAMSWLQTPGYVPGEPVSLSQTNPYFGAGWFGLWMTGLNMMPVSQLDGGHVIFALFGRQSRYIARAFFWGAIACSFYFSLPFYGLMFLLIFLMGIEHPPTSDDNAAIGPVRAVIGFLSLLIPIFTFPPQAILM